ncbi:MAG: HAD-IA family hydrolase [Enterococcus sp.]|nr:HAD-IA family hydrolase [Enterococcus sp.]
MKKDFLLFDLDGTIIEPSHGIYQSINYALSKMKRAILSEEQLRSFIGPPLHDSFVSLGMSKEEASEAIQHYREMYQKEGLYLMHPYPQIDQVLAKLSNKKKLFLATSKPESFAKEILDYLHFSQYFTMIGGANLEGTRSKKAEVIQHVFAQERSIDKSTAVMIGDRKYDIIGANENAIDSIGVLYGFGTKEELQEAGATKIVESPLELLSLME